MPLINGRFHANPVFGKTLEEGREEWKRRGELADDEMSVDTERSAPGRGRMHRMHIARDEDGIKVRVLEHGPGSSEASAEPSGKFTTHHFAHDDHQGVGDFVTSVLGRGRGKPTGVRPFKTERV